MYRVSSWVTAWLVVVCSKAAVAAFQELRKDSHNLM